MAGDFSRWTFDRRAGYRSVLLQQGRLLLDADWNEQAQITAHQDEVRTLDVIGTAGGPFGEAAFGILDGVGNRAAATVWEDLRVTPGRFYLDGVLAEVEADPGGAGPALAAQPFLPGAPGKELPGLPEPTADGRYALVLELREDEVTADEVPRLRESALGGPDTTTRRRTIWQLTLRKVRDDESCAAAPADLFPPEQPLTMTASLASLPPDKDPCQITTAAGYQRLENQLYRVQIHDFGKAGPRYLWSRENGSVVAGLTAIGPATAPMDAELALDREGRDEELSIGPDNVVEVTSAGRRLHGLPGFIARCGAPRGQTVPVKWIGTAPTDLDSLGEAPIVRRWEAEPLLGSGTEEELEGGIQVSFGEGDYRVGDYWLIPARTVRLVYGQTTLAGTIEWPRDEEGKPLPLPPLGLWRRSTVVGLLDRATSGGKGRWTLHADCRRLTPPLTRLIALDLLGGDGQEALPGTQLPQPIRVAVRNGGIPVAGARVRFKAAGGGLAKPPAAATAAAPAELVVETDANGQANVNWLLPAAGPAAQSLTATLLDDAGGPVGAEVRVGARLSVGAQVAYDPAACPDLAGVGAKTVQQAIDALCRRPGATFPGLHVKAVLSEADGKQVLNDSVLEVGRLLKGIRVVFDEPIDPRCAKYPVLTLTVEVPWPIDTSAVERWGKVVGGQPINLAGKVEADGPSILWRPDADVVGFLQHVIGVGKTILVRLSLLGNAVVSKDGKRFLNGRAFARPGSDRIDLPLPSVDDVHGADFMTWFWLKPLEFIDKPPAALVPLGPRIVVSPARLVFVDVGERLTVTIENAGDADLKFTTETVTTAPPGRQAYEALNVSEVVAPGGTQLFSVSSSALERGVIYAGQLRIRSNDPNQPEVTVELSSQGSPGIIAVPGGPLRLKPVREDVSKVLTGEAPKAAEARRLRKELEGKPLRLAVAPGFESSFEATRARLAQAGIEVARVEGDPAALAAGASGGKVAVDGVIGDGALANRLAEARRG